MGGIVQSVFLALLSITGALAVAMATGLSVVHWAVGRRPYLDADGWTIAAYGATALATWDVLTGEAGIFTAGWVAAASVCWYVAGRRSCGHPRARCR